MIWVRDGSGRRQVWGGSYHTKAEAKAEERRLLTERDAGSDLKPTKLTVAEIFDRYIAEKRNKVKASTLIRTEELLSHLRPILGTIPAARLKPNEISNAYNQLLVGLSHRTVRHCHWQLHGALALAVNWGQVPTNVADRVKPPVAEVFEGRALGHEEVRLLLDAVRPSPLAALVWLAVDSGARQGELLALRTDDVDLETGLIHISRSVRRVAGQGMVFSSPKTRLSRRTVEIAPTTVAILKAYRATQLAKRLKAGELWDSDGNLFFSNDTGGVLDGVGVTKAFQKIAAGAGLGALRFHDLRHTCVTLLLAAGVKMDDIRARVGHSSITTTVNVYGHRIAGTGSMAATMDAILTSATRESEGWLANG
ncbi:MAG: tyrosine-type recombinase/integrase [Dehalococcoidia bacterium]|nr:tyrosine-type recombinase/integrase [Dehalococcoidia bacterium]